MPIFMTDRAFGVTSREMTEEGFLKAPAFVARAGVQDYMAYELGLPGDPMRRVGVYRPEAEVFSQESLATYENKDITDDHPEDFINAENYSETTRGQVTSKGIKDGDMVRINVIIKDKKAIDALTGGKSALSAGYYCEYVSESGTFDGKPYELVQKDIRINHVALVDIARAGMNAKVLDKMTIKGDDMPKIKIGDNEIEVGDSNAAAVIGNKITSLEKQLEDSSAENAKLSAQNDSLGDEVKKLSEAASQKAIDAAVDEKLKIVQTAQKIIKDYDATGKSNQQIKIDVCKAVYKNRDSAKYDNEAYLDATFDMASEHAENMEDEQEEQEKKVADSIRDAFGGGSKVADAGIDYNKARFKGAK